MTFGITSFSEVLKLVEDFFSSIQNQFWVNIAKDRSVLVYHILLTLILSVGTVVLAV